MRTGKIISLFFVLVSSLFATWRCKPKNYFDKEVRLRTEYYKPYDIRFFYDELQKQVIDNKKNLSPLIAENQLFQESNTEKLYVVAGPHFRPEDHVISQLKALVAEGNTAFICSFTMSRDFTDSLFRNETENYFQGRFPPLLIETPLKVTWLDSSKQQSFEYPGHSAMTIDFKNYVRLDSVQADSTIKVLLADAAQEPVLISFAIGNGQLYLCNNPMMLTNYFLLHKETHLFLNDLIEIIQPQEKELIWDEYYKNVTPFGGSRSNNDFGVFKVADKYPPLKWALYLLIFGGLLYLINHTRRIMKEQPVLPPVKNTTLEFYETITGLYWNKEDHYKMAAKMLLLWREYLVNEYHLTAREITEENLAYLARKTGRSEELIAAILNWQQYLIGYRPTNEKMLFNLNLKLEEFYGTERNKFGKRVTSI